MVQEVRININDLVDSHDRLVQLRREVAHLESETASHVLEGFDEVIQRDEHMPVRLTTEQRAFVHKALHPLLCSGIDKAQLEHILNAMGLSLWDTLC